VDEVGGYETEAQDLVSRRVSVFGFAGIETPRSVSMAVSWEGSKACYVVRVESEAYLSNPRA